MQEDNAKIIIKKSLFGKIFHIFVTLLDLILNYSYKIGAIEETLNLLFNLLFVGCLIDNSFRFLHEHCQY